MIDVLQPGTSDVSQHLAHAGSQRSSREADSKMDSKMNSSSTEEDEESEEAAWLQSVQAASSNDLAFVKGLQSNNLVLDIGQLRDEPAPSAAKRSLRAKLVS
jgi:hypothetical protein